MTPSARDTHEKPAAPNERGRAFCRAMLSINALGPGGVGSPEHRTGGRRMAAAPRRATQRRGGHGRVAAHENACAFFQIAAASCLASSAVGKRAGHPRRQSGNSDRRCWSSHGSSGRTSKNNRLWEEGTFFSRVHGTKFGTMAILV